MSDDSLLKTRFLGTEAGRDAIEFDQCSLNVVRGPDAPAQCWLDSRCLRIGTSPSCDLVLHDSAVSRDHCEIRVERSAFRLRDLDSTNGTFVNGVRIQDAWVQAGDTVCVGETEVELRSTDERVRIPLSESNGFGEAVGQSVSMRELFHVLERVAPTDSTVLLVGETGTGKEVLAQAIHGASSRATGAILTLDCGSLAESLIESELFGHVRGAFTGASVDRPGVFEAAHGGTVFLDEVGELPLAQQAKLLRVLETRTVRRIGENQDRPLDIRVVAATNQPLAEQVEEGSFRKDLYFRLAVVEVRVPPLRDRAEDIPMLAERFLAERAESDGVERRMSAGALRVLASHRWPGNIRELRNTLERAHALLPVDQEEIDEAGVVLGTGVGEGGAASYGSVSWEDAQRRFEEKYLTELLTAHAGNVSQAAKAMGVRRTSLYRMLKRHGITLR